MNTDALRKKILDLAIRGKLVPQDPNDEPASALLECIRTEKQQMVKDGKLKKKDIKNDTVIYVGEDNLHYEKFQDGTVKCIEDEIPFELPEGWEWTRLGSVFFTVTGSTPSTKDTSLYGIDYPFYKPADLDAGYKVFKSESTVSEKGYRSGRPLPPHSVLVTCIGATIGKTGYIHNAGICNQQINAILPNTDILSDYTYFCICSQFEQQQILINSSATTLPILNKSKFDNLLFPVPPHEQQLLIVDKIQGMLTLVNKIQDNQEFLKDKIIATKSKILDLAIRGELVPQNPDDEPASVLLERIRAEKEELIKKGKIKRDKKESVIFKGDDNSYYEKLFNGKANCINEQLPFELPEGWEWTRLGCISDAIQYGLSNSAETFGDYRLLRITDIQDGHVDWDSVPFTSIDEPEKYLLHKNDIIFARTGATVGKSFFITDLPYASVYASYLIRIRLMRGISPNYVYQFFNSNCYWKQVTSKAVGVGQPNCNGTSLKKLFVPLPSKAEQQRIVNKISELFESLGCVEESLN